MKKINWGIIGCGDVTEIKSGPAFNKVSNSSLVAVMRVATPPSSHEEYAFAAMNAGKPVYVEKPMADSYAAACRMADAVDRAAAVDDGELFFRRARQSLYSAGGC